VSAIKLYLTAGLALLSGGLLALAFAPLSLYPLAIICPAILLLLWLKCTTPRHAFTIGLLFGVGFFSVGVSWVYISIHVYGHTSIILSLLITALFILILALFIAIPGYFFTVFFPENNRIKRYLIFPSLWAISEWLRSWVFTGFPWLLLSTSQVNSLFAAYAPCLGEFGCTFLLTLSSALLLDISYFLLYRCLALPIPRHTYFLLPFIMLISLGLISYGLSFVHWTRTLDKPLQVSLVQANIPQEIKWEPNYLQASLDEYLRLTETYWGNRLIIWPEAAIPILQHNVLPFLKQLNEKARQYGTTLITGIPIQNGFQYYNSMIALGVDHASYYKQQLVIFGEYLPGWIRWAQGLLNLLDIPMSSFSPGSAKQTTFKVANLDLGTFICYEIAYTNLVRQAAAKAQVLLTINDDAWFGHSFALAQHLQIGQFQALATGRYLLFLSNTGMTAIVTPEGKIQAQLPPFQSCVLLGRVYPSLGTTPWVKLGDCPIIIFLVGLIILCYAYLQISHK
jgi:apolipoprotein N-acyltransferase